jgi:integrase
MRGSLRSRRPGVWELIIQLPRDPLTGRPRQLSRTFHGTKREAQRALAAEVALVSAGKVTATTQMVADLLASWYERAAADLSPSTAREYRRLIDKRLLPALGRVRVRDLTPQQLDAFYGELSTRGQLAPASVRQVHAVMRRALAQAVRWGWLTSNPASNASPPKVRKPEITPPPLADTRALLAAADERDPDFGTMLRVIAATGARRGEVCALRWSDLDAQAGALTIRRSLAAVVGGPIEKDTKTHAARRIALDKATLAALAAHRAAAVERAAIGGFAFDVNSFMFTGADGVAPVHPDALTSLFRRLCDKLGLKGVRLHDLRHLHATQLLAAGVPVRTVSGRLGHANAATTLNVYAHFLEASDRDAADVIGGLLDGEVVGE